MFGGGQLLASLGLFMAGGYGTPRKIAGGAQNLSDMGAIIGMYLNGIGALIAISGGVMFIWVIARAILRSPQKSVSIS
jgi:cytochrome c oxidase subunit 1